MPHVQRQHLPGGGEHLLTRLRAAPCKPAGPPLRIFRLTLAALGSYNKKAKSDGYGGEGNVHVSRMGTDESVGTIMSSL